MTERLRFVIAGFFVGLAELLPEEAQQDQQKNLL